MTEEFLSVGGLEPKTPAPVVEKPEVSEEEIDKTLEVTSIEETEQLEEDVSGYDMELPSQNAPKE